MDFDHFRVILSVLSLQKATINLTVEVEVPNGSPQGPRANSSPSRLRRTARRAAARQSAEKAEEVSATELKELKEAGTASGADTIDVEQAKFCESSCQ